MCHTPNLVRQEEKKIILAKIIDWAQKRKKKVENLSKRDIQEAIKCKL